MPRDTAERKPPSQGALTSEEVRRRIAGVLRAETEISAADIAARIGVSLARVNGHLTALDLENWAVRCNGVGADGQRVTLWRARQKVGLGRPAKKLRSLVLDALRGGPLKTGELLDFCAAHDVHQHQSEMHYYLVNMERRGLVARAHRPKGPHGHTWSLPPPPAHLGDDGDLP